MAMQDAVWLLGGLPPAAVAVQILQYAPCSGSFAITGVSAD